MNKEFDPIVDMPYPKVKISKKDPYIANKLLNLYAGTVSEYTKASQYAFQSIYLNEYNDLSNIFKDISNIEIKHMQILGELIKELGMIPYSVTYRNNTPYPWNSDFVNFTLEYRDMLVDNIKKEKDTIESYQSLINEINDTFVQEILERIVIDEKRHLEIFNKLLIQYDQDK